MIKRLVSLSLTAAMLFVLLSFGELPSVNAAGDFVVVSGVLTEYHGKGGASEFLRESAG